MKENVVSEMVKELEVYMHSGIANLLEAMATSHEADTLSLTEAGQLRGFAKAIRTHHATLSALVAERDALRADAERYRWLRSQSAPVWLKWTDDRYSEGQALGAMDTAIDTARQATPAPDPLISGGAAREGGEDRNG